MVRLVYKRAPTEQEEKLRFGSLFGRWLFGRAATALPPYCGHPHNTHSELWHPQNFVPSAPHAQIVFFDGEFGGRASGGGSDIRCLQGSERYYGETQAAQANGRTSRRQAARDRPCGRCHGSGKQAWVWNEGVGGVAAAARSSSARMEPR